MIEKRYTVSGAETEDDEPCPRCEARSNVLASGVPGVLAYVEGFRVLGRIRRCLTCRRYESDEAATRALKQFLAVAACVRLCEIKHMVDRDRAMDGFSELANYREIIEEVEAIVDRPDKEDSAC